MKLLDRYLQSVQWLLPTDAKQDIIAELSEDIQSEIEEKESELGRKLDDAELAAILQRCGHPMLVAERYLPQRYLIGPALFSIYLFVLKMVALCYLVPWTLVWIGLQTFDSSYRAAHSLADGFWSLWHITINLFVFITVMFAIAECSRAKAGWLQKWNPLKVLAEPDPNRISRSDSIGELVGSVVFVLWWVGVIHLPSIPELTITLAPILKTLYWPILLVELATVAIACVNTFQPWWKRRRAGVHLVINCAAMAVAGVLLAAGPWVEITVAATPTPGTIMIAKWINLCVLYSLAGAGVSFVFKSVQDARRLRGKQPIRNWAMNLLGGN
jgi:hypothetical protein